MPQRLIRISVILLATLLCLSPALTLSINACTTKSDERSTTNEGELSVISSQSINNFGQNSLFTGISTLAVTTDSTQRTDVSETQTNNQKDDKKDTTEPTWLKVLNIIFAPVLSFGGAALGVVLTNKLQKKDRKEKKAEDSFDAAYTAIKTKIIDFKIDIDRSANYSACYLELKKTLDAMIDLKTIWDMSLTKKENLSINSFLLSLDPSNFSSIQDTQLKRKEINKLIDNYIQKVEKARSK